LQLASRLYDRGPAIRPAVLPRAQRLYEHAARDLDRPELLELIRDGRPAYARPHEPAAPDHARRHDADGIRANAAGSPVSYA